MPNNNEIQISYGDGKGGFSGQQTLNDLGEVEPAGGFDRRMTKLAVGDFNHDGHLDLVFIEGNRTTRVLSGDFVLILNDGSKHFTQQPPTDIEEPNEVITADVNQDGVDDIVIVTFGCTLDDGCPDADQPQQRFLPTRATAHLRLKPSWRSAGRVRGFFQHSFCC